MTQSPLRQGRRDGAVRYGHFTEPIGPIRVTDHLLRSPMGGFVSERERNAAFRSFQFIGAVGPALATGCAITNTSEGMTAFAYLWADGAFTELRLGARTGDVATFADDPDDGSTELHTDRGAVTMAAASGGGKRLTVNSDELTIDLSFNDDGFEALRLCTPTGPTGWAYVQKVAAVPAAGVVKAGDTVVDLRVALAHHDYTTGFLRPETWWHWACIAAQLPDGRRFGLNLSCGTNESGYRENCAWIDDHRFELGGALFDFDPADTDKPWQIHGPNGDFELTFHPGHGYRAKHDSPALATNFEQLFGDFTGWVTSADGERINVDGLSGFAESQYLRW